MNRLLPSGPLIEQPIPARGRAGFCRLGPRGGARGELLRSVLEIRLWPPGISVLSQGSTLVLSSSSSYHYQYHGAQSCPGNRRMHPSQGTSLRIGLIRTTSLHSTKVYNGPLTSLGLESNIQVIFFQHNMKVQSIIDWSILLLM